MYVECPVGMQRFRRVKAPTSAELTRRTQTLAKRVGRNLERKGLLERDMENSYLAGDGVVVGSMEQVLGASTPYRIAVGSQLGREVFTLQTLPACEKHYEDGAGCQQRDLFRNGGNSLVKPSGDESITRKTHDDPSRNLPRPHTFDRLTNFVRRNPGCKIQRQLDAPFVRHTMPE